jgi:hypothetical protein
MVGKSRKRHQLRHLDAFYRLFPRPGGRWFKSIRSEHFTQIQQLHAAFLDTTALRFGREGGKKGDDSAPGGGIRRFLSSGVEKPERQLYQAKISHRDPRATEFLPTTAMCEQFVINQVRC